MNTRMILLNAVAMPHYTQLEYWLASQKTSGFPPIHFWNLLAEELQEFDRTSTVGPDEIVKLATGLKSLRKVFDFMKVPEPERPVLMN